VGADASEDLDRGRVAVDRGFREREALCTRGIASESLRETASTDPPRWLPPRGGRSHAGRDLLQQPVVPQPQIAPPGSTMTWPISAAKP
jgi:hypothetical protein